MRSSPSGGTSSSSYSSGPPIEATVFIRDLKALSALLESISSSPRSRQTRNGPEGLGPQAERGSRSVSAHKSRAASFFIVNHPFIAGFSINNSL